VWLVHIFHPTNDFYQDKFSARNFISERERLKVKFWSLEITNLEKGCRWISFWGKHTSETDDPRKKAVNKTSAANIAGSILYFVTQSRN
jgi:hypothetical protein